MPVTVIQAQSKAMVSGNSAVRNKDRKTVRIKNRKFQELLGKSCSNMLPHPYPKEIDGFIYKKPFSILSGDRRALDTGPSIGLAVRENQ